jgi:hypothetical protein
MTDRQLLEDAARAAGIAVEFSIFSDGSFLCFKEGGDCFSDEWNPLTDDGDALRLAVKMNMEMLRSASNDPRPWVSAVIRNTTIHGAEDIGSDPYAATRRAITRAAAEIGRKMREQTCK